jgi:hypothetical protein
MSTFCSGSAGSGALTQLIAVGALDQYLTQGANFTFFKVKYTKHTNFAMESIGQPFNTAVAFGSEAQITLNRSGDLIYFMYAVIDLPGLSACELDTSSTCGAPGGGQFPSLTPEQQGNTAHNADLAVYADYMANDDDSHDTGVQKAAKDAWSRDMYGSCKLPACCDDIGDEVEHICPGENAWAHWVNGIGMFLIRAARIVIGGSTIDTLLNDYLFMYEELSGKSGKRLVEMVGRRYSRAQLLCDSKIKRTLYVPLPFWFTQHSGQALALASLQFHGVQIHIEFERLERCIVTSAPSGSGKHISVKNCATQCCLSPADLSACLETCYIFLEQEERSRFATSHHEVLISQVQSFAMQSCTSQVRMQLNFNHPVIELLWAVRRSENEKHNGHFNYAGINNQDPCISAALYLNNQARFSNKPGVWFRLVQPYQFHTNIPDCFIYVYSFALFPEDPTPSGSCNMSRIDHVDLALQLQDHLEKVTILVFARNWNILRFREGLAGIAYAN